MLSDMGPNCGKSGEMDKRALGKSWPKFGCSGTIVVGYPSSFSLWQLANLGNHWVSIQMAVQCLLIRGRKFDMHRGSIENTKGM